MAKFTFTGLDSIQYQLQARGAKVSGTVNHMLHAGAKIAREEMQAALKEYEIRDTGDLIKSIKASKIKKGDSGKYITICLHCRRFCSFPLEKPPAYGLEFCPSCAHLQGFSTGGLEVVKSQFHIHSLLAHSERRGGHSLSGKWNVEEVETEE